MGSFALIFGIVPIGVIVIVVMATSVRILRDYERAVIFRFGRRANAVVNPGGDGSGPGLVLLIPFIRAAARLTAKPDSGRRSRLKREVRDLDQELGRYAEAIATAGPLPSLLEALQSRERRRAALDAELGQLDALAQTSAIVDDVAVTVELRALCKEWRALLEEDPPIAQRIVRQMLTDRLTVERTPDGIRLSGMATFGPLMARIVLRGEMVPPG